MGPRATGACLAAAAALFWIAWWLMPGVGVTDAQRILATVALQRASVAASVGLQLVSAALYVPALVGVATLAGESSRRSVRGASALFLLGAMGSAADAVIHLLAYAMTQPGLAPEPLLPVMRFMQGPGLLAIAPLLVAFFAGGAWLSVALARAGLVSRWNPRLHALALVTAGAGGALASAGLVAPRGVGLATLGLVAAAQAWLGGAIWKTRGTALPTQARPPAARTAIRRGHPRA